MRFSIFILLLILLTGSRADAQQNDWLDRIQPGDTVIVWLHDKGVFKPVKRKIEISQAYKNWYRVVYEDSNGRIAKRKIHRHRIKKFIRRFRNANAITDKTVLAYVEWGITDKVNTSEKRITIADRKKCIRALHILKIWTENQG